MTQTDADKNCLLCRPADADERFERRAVWETELWRLTTSVSAADPVAGFSYLEPRRHIPTIADLDGPEAATLGVALARAAAAIRNATGCELVYVYVFGGSIAHLHLHLAPYVAGGPLSDAILRGATRTVPGPGGTAVEISDEFAAVPPDELAATADRIRAEMNQPGLAGSD